MTRLYFRKCQGKCGQRLLVDEFATTTHCKRCLPDHEPTARERATMLARAKRRPEDTVALRRQLALAHRAIEQELSAFLETGVMPRPVTLPEPVESEPPKRMISHPAPDAITRHCRGPCKRTLTLDAFETPRMRLCMACHATIIATRLETQARAKAKAAHAKWTAYQRAYYHRRKLSKIQIQNHDGSGKENQT